MRRTGVGFVLMATMVALYPTASRAHVFLGPKFFTETTHGRRAELQLGNTRTLGGTQESLFFTLLNDRFAQVPFTHVQIDLIDPRGERERLSAPLQTIGGLCAHTVAYVPYRFPGEGTYRVVTTYMQEATAVMKAEFVVPVGAAVPPSAVRDVRGTSPENIREAVPPPPVVDVPQEFRVRGQRLAHPQAQAQSAAVATEPARSSSRAVWIGGGAGLMLLLGVWVRKARRKRLH